MKSTFLSNTQTRFAAQHFDSLESAGFDIETYSRLKFGQDRAAKQFGYELAEKFFETYKAELMSQRVVVIPSPYNHVKNAATVMTSHFIDRLNELLIEANGEYVEYSTIHRKVSYTNDYGFLSKDERRKLIDNDSFYVNKDFIEGKTLVFVDDVIITGTHEEKLQELLARDALPNKAFFIYYAQYTGDSPSIEADLNFAAIRNPTDYFALSKYPQHHVIIRPIKYILSQSENVLEWLLEDIDLDHLRQMYYGCLAEGYYKIPSYQENFQKLKAIYKKRSNG